MVTISNLKLTNLGGNSLISSKLGLGCMGMLPDFYGAPSTSHIEATQTIHRAYELGINHFDTADCYSYGKNETLLGSAIKGMERDRIIISTKCGIERRENEPEFFAINNTPEYIKKCCEESLKRLNTDYIDLLYLHRINKNIPIEESMKALSALVKEGKVLNIGLSEVGVSTVEKAHAIHPLTAIQSEYSLWSREPEKEILPLCKALNITFVAFGPMGSGFLTGKFKTPDALDIGDVRRTFPRFQQEHIYHNMQIIKILKEIADKKECTTGQIALAWVLAQSNNIIAIPGTKQVSHLEENIASMDLKLSKEDVCQLDNQIPLNFASGIRMSEEMAKLSEY